MYTKFIPKNIQEKLKAKERALAYKELKPGESDVAGVIKPQDIQSRTTFVRMCSNKIDAIDNILISGGKVNSDDGKQKFGVSVDAGSQSRGLYNKKSNNQIRPVAGIKSIEVNYKGSYKAIREATVNWIVGSIQELDELTPYFLTVGKTVVLDWGWVNSNVKNFSQMYNDTPFITWREDGENGGRYNVDQKIFDDGQVRVQNMGGDYDAIGGKVSNFEMTMRPDGGFDCVTKITALGSSLFQKPIDRPTDQISIISKPLTKEQQEQLADSDTTAKRKAEIEDRKITSDKQGDNIINALINLQNIIKHNVLGWPVEGGELKEVVTGKWNPFKKNEGGKSGYSSFEKRLHFIEKNYAIAVDDFNNVQVCWVVVDGKENFFVKWGYMEDQILNRYLSYDAGSEDGAGIKITFRSIKTVIDDNTGLPVPIVVLQDQNESDEVNVKTVVGDKELTDTGLKYQSESYTVKGGDTFGNIAEENNISIVDLQELNRNIENINQIKPGDKIVLPPSSNNNNGSTVVLMPQENGEGYIKDVNKQTTAESFAKFVNDGGNSTTIPYTYKMPQSDVSELEKESTKIRNLYTTNNFFYPIAPFKFWSPELLPPINRIGVAGLAPGGNVEKTKKLETGEYSEDVIFKKLYKRLQSDFFHVNKFTEDDESGSGILRNMWVNIEEIQKAFGVDMTVKDTPKANPPGTFENGIKALLKSLNSNFYGVWDFELAVDPYDSTNVGVVDKNTNTLTGKDKNITYTSFVSDIDGSEVTDREGNSSHRVQDLGIYKFPSFKAGSIVKNQNLSFKIPDSMALTILYGSNKPLKTDTHNATYNNPEMMKLFGKNIQSEYDDKYLVDMVPSNISKDETPVAQRVGSHKTNPNSKIVKNLGILITTNESWGYKQWLGPTQTIDEANKARAPKFKLTFSGDNIILVKEITIKRLVTEVVGFSTDQVDPAREGEYVLDNSTPFLFHYSKYKKGASKLLNIKKDAERLIRSRLNGTLKGEDKNFLKVDTIIPAELTLEIDGIGGISPGDLVHTNYIQEEYAAEIVNAGKSFGPYAYFQVFGLSQKVDSATWSTELVTKMRINHIPNSSGLSIKQVKEEIIVTKKKIVLPVKKKKKQTFPEKDTKHKIDPEDVDIEPEETEIKRSDPDPDPDPDPIEAGVFPPYDEFVLPESTPDPIIIPTDTDIIEPFKKPPPPVKIEEDDTDDDDNDDDDDDDDDDDQKDFRPIKPPIIVEKKVEKKKEKQRIKAPASLKNPTAKKTDLKDTYRGEYNQNEYLYQLREDWRPLYITTGGTKTGARPGNDVIREQQSFSIRKEYWHNHIEAKNEEGTSFVPFSPYDYTGDKMKKLIISRPPENSGIQRINRNFYWKRSNTANGNWKTNYSGD